MKKGLFAVILICAIVLVACGAPKKPDTMSQKTYDNGCRALEIMEKYNNVEISADDAEERLRGIYESLQAEHGGLTDSLESGSNTIVTSDVFLFIAALGGAGSSTTYELETNLREYLEK